MDCYILVLLACMAVTTSAWSTPFYPVHRAPPIRVTRYAPLPHRHKIPIRQQQPKFEQPEPTKWDRPKREHYDNDDYENKGTSGVTGPVHTFVKTDKNANYKWGVRHHVGNKYAS
nr:uncharacterized protein LOC113393554 isoform X1 [Vanessa tameamea]